MTQSPTLIYLALESWFSSTRLPKFLRAAGFNTIALCPPGSLLAQSRHLDDRILAPLDAIPGALDAAHATYRPTLIVPADEAAIQLLHRLARTLDEAAPLRRTIARSLGELACRGETLSKQQINGHAARAGIRVPRQAVCGTPDQALAFCRAAGYPIVLKKDDTYGGFGVRLCRDERAVLVNWHWLQAEDRRGRIAARVAGTIASYIPPLRQHLSARPGRTLIAQSFVSGQLAFRSFVADRGDLLAGITAVAEAVDPPPFGASSVVRFGEHAVSSRATRDLVRALGL